MWLWIINNQLDEQCQFFPFRFYEYGDHDTFDKGVTFLLKKSTIASNSDDCSSVRQSLEIAIWSIRNTWSRTWIDWKILRFEVKIESVPIIKIKFGPMTAKSTFWPLCLGPTCSLIPPRISLDDMMLITWRWRVWCSRERGKQSVPPQYEQTRNDPT